MDARVPCCVCPGLLVLKAVRVLCLFCPFLALQDATQNADPVAHPSSVGLLCTGTDLTESAFLQVQVRNLAISALRQAR